MDKTVATFYGRRYTYEAVGGKNAIANFQIYHILTQSTYSVSNNASERGKFGSELPNLPLLTQCNASERGNYEKNYFSVRISEAKGDLSADGSKVLGNDSRLRRNFRSDFP